MEAGEHLSVLNPWFRTCEANSFHSIAEPPRTDTRDEPERPQGVFSGRPPSDQGCDKFLIMDIASGHSDDVDADEAALEAVELALGQLVGEQPKAILVFTGVRVDARRVLQTIAGRLPDVPLVGATSAAEVSRQRGATDSSVLVLLLSGDGLEVGVGLGRETGDGAQASAVEAVLQARAGLRSEPRLCISFTALDQNPSVELEAVVSALGTPNIPVFGGVAACEYGNSLDTEVLFGVQAHAKAFVVLLIGGGVRHTYAVASGWTPVGGGHTITKLQERNLVVEIDGKPAIDVYSNYLGTPGGFGAMFVHHPLEVAVQGGAVKRVAFGSGPLPGSLLMDGDLPEGASVRLCEFNREQVMEATRQATSQALSDWSGDPPSLALVIECASRLFALGTWMERSAQVVRDTLPPTTQIVGMHSLGEFAPLVDGGPSVVHNCCIVVLLVGAA